MGKHINYSVQNLLIFVFALCQMGDVVGQNLKEIISSEDNYYQIVEKAEQYFKNPDAKSSKEYKHYMRWKGEVQYHVNPDGALKNFNAVQFKAAKKFEKLKNPDRATHGDWSNIGPFDYWGGDVFSGGGIGRINCTAFHPTNPSIFWVGAANGGLWKTTDAGNTWTPMTDAFSAIGISGIVVNQTDPDQIYILTGDGDASTSATTMTRNSSIGVLKTDDGGENWKQTSLSFDLEELKYGYKLIAHPTNPETLFVTMSDDGIYRTLNGGASWTQVESGKTVWDIEYAPGDPSKMYAASDSGFLRSVDFGASWEIDNDAVFPGLSLFSRCAIAISPSAPSNVYIVFGGASPGNGLFRGCYKSTNNGLSFTLQSNSPNILDGTMSGSGQADQAWYDLAMIVDPTDDSRVFVGGINLWKSEDNGVSWGRETWWTKNFEPLDPYVHADWHNIYFNGSTLYANVDGGIYKSTDQGNDWSELTAGLSILQLYEIDVKGSTYIGGAQDNGTHEADDTNPQSHALLGGDGFGCTWHTTNTSIQYLSTQDRLARRQFESNVFIWEETNGFWRTDLKMHTTDADYFFFDKGNELFRANQADAIWDFNFDSLKTNNALTGGGEILGYDQGTGSNDEIMYVVNNASVIKTSNLSSGSPTWTTKTNPVAGAANISDVIQDPLNSNEVWITCSGYVDTSKVYYSTNGGSSWTNITGSLPDLPVRCITYHSGTNNGIYVGTDLGIFYRDASMSDWVYFSNQLPNTRITDIEISDANIYAGTYGRGVWKSPAYTSCPWSLTLTQANDPSNLLSQGEQQYHALNAITSTREIVGSTAEIFYNSGNFIDMKPGFVARESTFWQAKVSGCPD